MSAIVDVPDGMEPEEIENALRLYQLMDDPDGFLEHWDERGYGDE